VRASASTPDFGRLPSTQARALARFHSDPGPVQNPINDKPFLAKRNEPTCAVPSEVLFGPFRLLPTQFLLMEGDEPVELGSRALEILIVLLERAGELISKQELMARVWPDVFVGPANLTVHISALRRTLRDGQDGNRFIINIPGRGYKFVASVAPARHQNVPLSIVSRTAPELEGRPQTQTFSDCRARKVRVVHPDRASAF